jgi:uncharacterized protein (TIGR02677 family)
MWLEPRLRKSGRTGQPGRAPEVVDLSKERELLRRLAEEENAQIARAHTLLARDEPMHLSGFADLTPSAFHLLLDLLGRAVAASAGRGADQFPVVATSTDGSLAIELSPPPEGAPLAHLQTAEGILSGPDYEITIRPAEGRPAPIRAA